MNRIGPRGRVVAGVAAATVASAWFLELSPHSIVRGLEHSSSARAFFAAALHPTLLSQDLADTSLVPALLHGLFRTLQFAVGAIGLGILGGLPLGILASQRIWHAPGGHPVVWRTVRVLIALMRSVHELLLAILLLAIFGRSPAAAVIAIAIPTAGTLAKVFAELIDEAEDGAAAALRSIGATPLQASLLGLVPRTLPDLCTIVFYRFECALRAATVLGFFGFQTLGYLILKSAENLYFQELWAFLYALIGLMFLTERWSAKIRGLMVRG